MAKEIFINRREFLDNAAESRCCRHSGQSHASDIFTINDTLTVSQVIERIIADVPGGKLNDTVDTLKSGSGDHGGHRHRNDDVCYRSGDKSRGKIESKFYHCT